MLHTKMSCVSEYRKMDPFSAPKPLQNSSFILSCTVDTKLLSNRDLLQIKCKF